MAMMRLLARDTKHIAVMPPVVVRDELNNGTLKDYGALPRRLGRVLRHYHPAPVRVA